MLNIVRYGAAVLEKLFLSISLYITILCKSSRPWGGAISDPRDFIWTNWNLPVLGMLHANYCPIWCSSSWEEDFLNISLYITILKFKPLGWAMHDPRDFILTNLNLLVLGKLLVKYCSIYCNISWEEDFLSISLYITM